MAKKGFFKWIWEDVILAFAVAVGLDVVVKTQWPKLLSELGMTLSSTMKRRVDNDKRAEMLRELRRMEVDAGINIDNLDRRYANSIQNRPITEYLLVELLCKIPLADPNDPLSIRPPVAPGIPGAPQNDRQADLKWLNDMPDERFYRMFEFLNHNVISQWWRIGRDWVIGVLTGLGIAGVWVLGILRILWHFAMRLFQWVSRSLWRMAFVALVAWILFWPLALIVMAILTWFRGRGTPGNLFKFIGILIGVNLVIGIYFMLVPTSSDRELTHVVLMAIAATFFLWSVRWVRISLFSLIAICTLIFFFGGRTVAKAEVKTIWQGLTAVGNGGGNFTKDQNKKKNPGVSEGSHDTSDGGIPNPLAPARPTGQLTTDAGQISGDPNGAKMPSAPANFPGHCGIDNDPNPPLFAYGKYQIFVQHCVVTGNQIIVSGLIQWGKEGGGQHLAAFHAFHISDLAGNIYEVQDGELGRVRGFGMGYFQRMLDGGAPMSFSFVAGPVNPREKPSAINVTMSNTQGDLQNVAFYGLLEKAE